MTKWRLYLAAALCIALGMSGCAPADTKPAATEASSTAAQIQSKEQPDDALNVSVPYSVYPEDVEYITMTVHVLEGAELYGALAPQVERLTDNEWVPLLGEGYCGTPDKLRDGTQLRIPIQQYEGAGAGKYRVSLGASKTMSSKADMRVYAEFELTDGVSVSADPRAYTVDGEALTLVVYNPSDGDVTLADEEIRLETMSGGEWVGCGSAEAEQSLALKEGEKGWVSVALQGEVYASGTYRMVVTFDRDFHGEEVREVRMPEFQIK